MQRVLHQYEDCELTGVPPHGLRSEVRYVCETGVETRLQEGHAETEWVTLRTTRAHDGYGNVTLEANHGVVGQGPDGSSACPACTAPAGTASGACGPDCLGVSVHAAVGRSRATRARSGSSDGAAVPLRRATQASLRYE